MEDNNQNNWKILLESPQSFPGETIRDKNEAWEKLYLRLHGKSRRRFPALYWAAAALLVIVTSSVILVTNKGKRQDRLVGIPSQTKKQIPVITESELNTQKKNSDYVLSQPKQKSKTIVPKQKNVLVKAIPSVNKHLIIDSIVEQLPKMVITSNTMHDSTIKIITAAAPAKKKLRVVHINEIGQPIEYPTVNNRFSGGRGFEFRIINGEIYNPANTSSSNNGLILTKPHNTSN